jgi:Uma2 family endonuclease
MSTVAKFTVVDYDRLIDTGFFEGPQPRRIELIYGELRDMTPIGIEHEIAVDKLNEWSIRALPLNAAWVRVQESVGLPELDSVPQPDIGWVTRRDYKKTGRPTSDDVFLVIEVAHSSLRYDSGEKSELYATAGVKEYWIVNLIDRYVEVRRKASGATYQEISVHRTGEKISPLTFPDVSLPVALLFE